MELARFCAETRCQPWLDQLRPDRAITTGDQVSDIAAEVEEEEVAAILAEVEDRHRQLVGDDFWYVVLDGTPEQRQALPQALAEREPAQEPRPASGSA